MNLEIRCEPLSTGPQVAFALRIGLLRYPALFKGKTRAYHFSNVEVFEALISVRK